MEAFLQKLWSLLLVRASQPLGAVLIFVVCWVSFSYLTLQLEAFKSFPLLATLISLVPAGIATGFLFHSALPPKSPRGTQGICLAFRTENEQGASRIDLDLADPIRRVLISTPLPIPFHVFSVSSKFADNLTTQEHAKDLLFATRSRLLLYGDLRKRKSLGKEVYVLRFEGMVSHALTQDQNSSLLREEMSLILPTNLRIDCDHDLEGFEITSNQLAHAAQYIVAIAYLISGATHEAGSLLRALYESRGALEKAVKLPNAKKLLRLVPQRLYEVILREASELHFKWRSSHDAKLIDKIEALLSDLPIEYKASVQARNLRAMCGFILRRDTKFAKAELVECRKADSDNPVYSYSLAFLAAYNGNLDEAYGLYRAAFNRDSTAHLAVEVEEFIAWCAEEEPEKVQLYFAMGYINGRQKKDAERAIQDFQIFIASADPSGFQHQIQIAHRFVKVLKAGHWIKR